MKVMIVDYRMNDVPNDADCYGDYSDFHVFIRIGDNIFLSNNSKRYLSIRNHHTLLLLKTRLCFL